jgi:hypothetical protein
VVVSLVADGIEPNPGHLDVEDEPPDLNNATPKLNEEPEDKSGDPLGLWLLDPLLACVMVLIQPMVQSLLPGQCGSLGGNEFPQWTKVHVRPLRGAPWWWILLLLLSHLCL